MSSAGSEELKVPPLLLAGIDLFNAGSFFECHEVLEKLWNTQRNPEKQFTQGLIQLAVATYHLERGNLVGARRLYERGLTRIRQFFPSHLGIDVADLSQQCERLLSIAGSSERSADEPPNWGWFIAAEAGIAHGGFARPRISMVSDSGRK